MRQENIFIFFSVDVNYFQLSVEPVALNAVYLKQLHLSVFTT